MSRGPSASTSEQYHSPQCRARRGPYAERVTGLRGLFVGNDQSLAERMRRRRWSLVTQLVPRLQTLSVLDLGGTALFWARSPVRPRDVTVINLHEPGDCAPGVTAIRGDTLNATRLMAGRRFDLVFSNSLIEHLQGHAARLQFAEVVASMSSSYIVQRPTGTSKVAIGCGPRDQRRSPAWPGAPPRRPPLGQQPATMQRSPPARARPTRNVSKRKPSVSAEDTVVLHPAALAL